MENSNLEEVTPLEVMVTGPEGCSLKLLVRKVWQTEEIAADLLIYGCAFIRQDTGPPEDLLGMGISEMLQKNLDEWKGNLPDGPAVRLTRTPVLDLAAAEKDR
jgi:hypothetical protein